MPQPASPVAQVAALEMAILSSPVDPNPLVPLLALARHANPAVAHKAIWALHRVFIAQINEGRVGVLSVSAGAAAVTDAEGSKRRAAKEDDEDGADKAENQARAWVRSRLLEYVEIMGGLLRDTEDSLRSSALQLLFALLPPLSDPSPLPYFRLVLRALLTPSASLRGAKPSGMSSSTWSIDPSAQTADAADTLPPDAAAAASLLFADHDDLRLLFFREAAAYLPPSSPAVVDNLLALLLPLTNLPRVPADLNAFYIPAFASPPANIKTRKPKKGEEPPKKKAKTAKGNGKGGGELDALPAWMETYDSASSDDDAPGIARQRVSALNTHAAVHSIPAHAAAYTELWEAVLSAEVGATWTRKVLVGLHGPTGILSHMRPERRVRVADWLGGVVDGGGAPAMLAMNGLFVLMTQYNLDYPNFYTRLYGLLDADVLHVKYRARFFRLLDTFLRSTLLPAALVASFIKRLARLCLTAPPAGAILAIPFIYNLLKRHPSCMPMLHRVDAPEAEPYDAAEPSPLATCAIESSLYELAALRSHYLAAVGTMAKVFEEQFTKPEFSLEDFLDHGYGTMIDNEVGRKVKAAAVSEGLEMRNEVWPKDDVVAELWAI
ncbi:Maturation and nuclear export of 40S ribosomal subunits interacting protein [Cryptotrichosporon argae]